MRKPQWQWRTRRHHARRLAEPPPAGGAAVRAERFTLERVDEDGTATPLAGGASILFTLDRQEVPRAVLELESAEDLERAARAWLIARGRRQIHLVTDDAEVLASGAIAVDAFDRPARGASLITLCPSNAEMVDALDAFDRVIACESSSDHPPGVESVERLGPDLDPDLDRVESLAPGLVVSSLSVPGMERIVTGLAARGIPQVVLAPRTLADVGDELLRLGHALGVSDAATRARARFDAELSQLRSSRPQSTARVYLEWWPRPMFTPGGDCFSNELIDLAGGVNVFDDRSGSSVEIEPADLVAADPQLCFLSWCGAPVEKLDPRRLVDRPGLESLEAARRGRVYPLDERFSGRPGPRMLEAARIMRRAILDGSSADA
jgi:iron complex transport system substrate-binding protein